MQGLILAAGKGTRLGSYTSKNPKCMLEINGKTLIQRQIESLTSHGINRIIIVCGYKKENLKKYLEGKYNSCELIFVENNEYEFTNNIYSLYLAKEYLKQDDTILLESDLIFEESIIGKILESDNKNIVTVSKYQNWMDGTVLTINDKQKVNKIYTKQYFDKEKADEHYKTINIYKLSKALCIEKYIPRLENYINSNETNEFYEVIFRDLIQEDSIELNTQIFNNEKWYEIDNNQDLENARNLFSNNI